MPRVLELIERAAGDQRRHAGLEHGRGAVRKAHGALAFEAGEDLVLVVAMHLVMVAGIGIVMHPGMHLAGVHHHRALLLTQRDLFRVDDLNSHCVPPDSQSMRHGGIAKVL